MARLPGVLCHRHVHRSTEAARVGRLQTPFCRAFAAAAGRMSFLEISVRMDYFPGRQKEYSKINILKNEKNLSPLSKPR
jgi:hypothetical protein